MQRLKRARVNFNIFIEHGSFCVFFALMFSRIVFFFMNPDLYFPGLDFRTFLNFISIWDRGFSLWGALFGFLFALTWQIKKQSESGWRWADALVVPVIVGMMIGDFGAFLGGYDYGTPTELPWGVRYELYNVKYTVPVHPTQLYAILGLGLLLYGFNRLKNKYDFWREEGNPSLILMTGFSAFSFLLEFIKGDDTIFLFQNLRLPLILFALSTCVGSLLLYKRFTKTSSSPTPQAP